MRYLLLVFLLISAIVDIRTKKLPCLWIYMGLAGGIIYALYQFILEERTLKSFGFALLPGFISYVVAKVSKALGEADALLILEMGFVFSCFMVIEILMLALFLAAIASVILLIFRRNQKNKSIPFVPYLFLALGIVLTG